MNYNVIYETLSTPGGYFDPYPFKGTYEGFVWSKGRSIYSYTVVHNKAIKLSTRITVGINSKIRNNWSFSSILPPILRHSKCIFVPFSVQYNTHLRVNQCLM